MRFRIYEQLSAQAKALFWAGLWAVVYLILIVALPPNLATMRDYQLSIHEFRVLVVLTGLPNIMVWFMSFFGYSALTQYAETVDGTSEGKSFGSIARGLKWLTWGLPINACATAALGGFARLNPQLISGALIVSHYLYLLISLVAFTLISDGSRGLRDIINKLPSKQAVRVMIGAAIIISVTYCAITLNTVRTQHPNTYRLPLWLILLTIIMPYLYAWLMGLFAVFEIGQYRRSVRGLFYKQALRLLASGTTLAIIASVALQYLVSSSLYLRRIDLNWTLLISYSILILFAVGFILIAVGASKLKKIEEV